MPCRLKGSLRSGESNPKGFSPPLPTFLTPWFDVVRSSRLTARSNKGPVGQKTGNLPRAPLFHPSQKFWFRMRFQTTCKVTTLGHSNRANSHWISLGPSHLQGCKLRGMHSHFTAVTTCRGPTVTSPVLRSLPVRLRSPDQTAKGRGGVWNSLGIR